MKIKDCDPDCVKKCVEFIYSGVATVAKEKREPMMHVAHLMQLHRTYDFILRWLHNPTVLDYKIGILYDFDTAKILWAFGNTAYALWSVHSVNY